MFSKNTLIKSVAAAIAILAAQSSFADDKLIDSMSLDVASGTRTQMVRLGVQQDWSARWFQSNGTHLSGYWDASVGVWRANHYQNIDGQTQHLWDIGLDPVFRWENDNKKGIYYEGGIGAHVLSKLYDNDTYRLSTAFQFGDHIGIGYIFDNKWEVAAKIQHFSNGGIKEPNTGVNFFVLKAAYHF
jgi:lipid A 3-O-deacylase